MAIHSHHKFELGGKYMSSDPGAYEFSEDSVHTVLYKGIIDQLGSALPWGLG